MKDMLLTYNEYNRQLGYVQGMSDLLAPIYAVEQDDAVAFWGFVGFMERMVNTLCFFTWITHSISGSTCELLAKQSLGFSKISLLFASRLLWNITLGLSPTHAQVTNDLGVLYRRGTSCATNPVCGGSYSPWTTLFNSWIRPSISTYNLLTRPIFSSSFACYSSGISESLSGRTFFASGRHFGQTGSAATSISSSPLQFWKSIGMS